MAKVTFNKQKFTKQIKGMLDNAPYDRIGRTVVESIKRSVRQGISPATGRPIPDLKESTVDRRTKLAPINRTSKFFEAGKSNLTFTGQLLNALSFAVFRTPKNISISIFTRPSFRRPYRGLRGGNLQSPDNSELQEEMETGNPALGRVARPYVGIDASTELQVQGILKAHIKRELSKIK